MGVCEGNWPFGRAVQCVAGTRLADGVVIEDDDGWGMAEASPARREVRRRAII